MEKYPNTTAVIEGHTDEVGTDENNMELSRLRAESVVNYMVGNFGVNRSRFSAEGYGQTRRFAYNTTPEGQQKNRRVNITMDFVVKK